MYVAMPYFVFVKAMVSCLIHGENMSHVGNSICLFHFIVLWTNVRLGHVYLSFLRNPMMPLCCICFSLCFAIHLMDCIDVIVSCMIVGEPMCFTKPLYRDLVSIVSYVHNGTHSLSEHGI